MPAAYWDSLAGTAVKQGPRSLMRHELEKSDIGRTDMNTRDINGRWVQLAGTRYLALQVPGAARDALCRAQAKRRMHLRGLEQGRDEAAMTTLMKERKCPKDAAMMVIVLADSVYTPSRAHVRWGFAGGCSLCGYVNDCPCTP